MIITCCCYGWCWEWYIKSICIYPYISISWTKLNVVKFREFKVLKLTNSLSIVAIDEDKGKKLNVFVFVHIFALYRIIDNVVYPWLVKL